jgi:hypothetical protein
MNASEASITFADVISPHVAALLFISTQDVARPLITNNATASFVDTGKSSLLVTNAHVIHAFDQKLLEDPTLLMVIGGGGALGCLVIERVWLKALYIKTDLKIDLATFELPQSFDISKFGKRFYRPDNWPPPRIAVGDLAVICGFPGEHRLQESESARVNIDVIADTVSSVGDVSFTLADEPRERALVKLNPELNDLGSFGGISGSAVYHFTKSGDHRLAGFLHETHEGLNAQIRAIHADFIREDGSLDYGLLPYRIG